MKPYNRFLSVLLCFSFAYSLLFPVLAQSNVGGSRDGDKKNEINVGPAPGVRINSPSSDRFFKGGKEIFPRSFQLADPEATVGKSVSQPHVSPDYPVGPGDQFLVSFWGRIEDNLLVSVNSSHKLFIPRLGVIETKGITYAELEVALTQKINSKMREVQFTISLYKARDFNVYVLGAVPNPGSVNVQSTYRASDVIKMAGGILPVGSKQYIEVRRAGKILQLDLLRFASHADFSKNPYVTNNDVIFVPVLTEFVTISGAVVQPGTFEIKETRNLKEILESIGGLSIYADVNAPIKLSRVEANGSRKRYEIYAQVPQGSRQKVALTDGFLLQKGDEIFVPSTQLLVPSQSETVYVTGEVKIPGPKPYRISTPVEEYIGASGGLSQRANFSNAVVYKADGSTIPVEPRMSIDPGDTIYIPERTFKFWQDHLAIVTTFITLATSIIVLSGK